MPISLFKTPQSNVANLASRIVELFGELSPEVTSALLNISPQPLIGCLNQSAFIIQKRTEYHKTRNSFTKTNTHQNKSVGWISPWLSGSGYRRALRRSTAGMYVNTIDFVDIAPLDEQRAVWGKGEQASWNRFARRKTLPSLSLASIATMEESLNYTPKTLCWRKQPVQFTRSRAYHKDDNAHIEQKNWTHIRQWLGYDRSRISTSFLA